MGATACRTEKAATGELVTRVSSLEGHRLWARGYDSTANPILALEERSMRNLLQGLRPATVLDVACGTGRWLLHFQQSGASACGVDGCEEMLAQARKRLGHHGNLAVGDAAELPLADATADLILSCMALGYFPDLYRVFSELFRVARVGGYIAVSDLHPEAIAAGWTRSFRAGDSSYEIEHFCYAVEDVECIAATAGLSLIRRAAAHLGEPERPILEDAGKDYLLSRAHVMPALFLALWRKPC